MQAAESKRGVFRDPAFVENRNAPIHRWTPWIAGYSAQFIEDVFREYLPSSTRRHPLILDPFCGVGTTLVQAMLNGYHAVGFEINPYAALVTRTKLNADRLDESTLDELIERIEKAPSEWNGSPPPLQYRPAGFRSRIAFFSPNVEAKVLRILEMISSLPHSGLADMARIAFGAVMVRVSNYTYEPSLSSRPGSGKPLIEDADVHGVLSAKLSEMREDITWLGTQMARLPRRTIKREVHCDDFFSRNSILPSGTVDLMVTSPPYMNNYHYIRNTRPQLFWLSLVAETGDLRRLEEANFGKYWQTVREVDPIPLQCNHQGLNKLITQIRKTRVEAKAYGGPGWANYVTAYFNDCDRFTSSLKRVLRRGGVGVVVIGNSIIQGIPVPTDEILADLATAKGLKLEQNISLRTKRVGASITQSSVRRGQPAGNALYENAVVVRKR